MTYCVGDYVKIKPKAIKAAIDFAMLEDNKAVRKFLKQAHKIVMVDGFGDIYDDFREPSELFFKLPIWIERDAEWSVMDDKVVLVRRAKCECDWKHCRRHGRKRKSK